MNFEFTSGPSFILTFLAVLGYAIYTKAPFQEVWIALGSLYGLHIGKRLWQKLKDPRIGLEVENMSVDQDVE
jgi:uncharacterized membrane protein YfcA